MPSLSKRFISLSNIFRRKNPEFFTEEKLIIDFSKTKKSPFDIKSENSYNAYLSKNSLTLELKKPNCIAWTTMPDREYGDHIIEAKIRIDSLGGYASSGLLFRIEDDESYYLALVSGKGYFRFDSVKNNVPKTLIAWTEISDFDGENFNLNIITYGTYLIFVVNGKWVGETNDDSINSGRIGLALASYEAEGENKYTCRAMLDYIAIDTRMEKIEEEYKKWNDDSNINADCRLRLAETLAVMGEPSKALEQILRAWKRRDEAISSFSATYAGIRTRRELLLAARMSFWLGQYSEAEKFIDAIIEQLNDDPQRLANSAEVKEALTEKIKILNEMNKFAELKKFVLKYFNIFNKNIDFYTLLARSYWELKKYKDSAKAWDKAFQMNGENGVYAANAANALELDGKNDEALARFMEAGKIFLKQNNTPELAVLIPKLTLLGTKNHEARALAGKCAFTIEDYELCEAEFTAANKLRCAIKPRPKADPAMFYLWGLVLSLRGKTSEAIRLLERAVRLAPDYGLFRFKLAELKLTNSDKDPKLANELRLALELTGDDPEGKMAAHAGNLLLNSGDPQNAKYFFEKAGNNRAD
jgi:tetratricopeptide (TPR) repeat protein